MKRGLPGVKAPRAGARDRRPHGDRHAGADQGHQDAELARRRSPRTSARPTGPAKRVDQTLGPAAVRRSGRSYGDRSADERQHGRSPTSSTHAALAEPHLGAHPAVAASRASRCTSPATTAPATPARSSAAAASLKDASKQGAAKNAMSLARALQAARAEQHVAGLAALRVLVLVGGRVRDRRASTAARACCGCYARSTARSVKGAGRKLTDRARPRAR